MKNNARKILSALIFVMLTASTASCGSVYDSYDSHDNVRNENVLSPTSYNSAEIKKKMVSDTLAISYNDAPVGIYCHSISDTKTISDDVTVKIKWTDPEDTTWTGTYIIPFNVYNYAISHEIFKTQNYRKVGYSIADYVKDDSDKELFSDIAETIIEAGDKAGYSTLQKIDMIISLVKSIETIEDKDADGYDITHFPVETLYLQKGSTGSKIALAAEMLNASQLCSPCICISNGVSYLYIPCTELEMPETEIGYCNNKLYYLIEL